ncbi:Uncharacterised protein [Serratia plymuthica]|nr:Uncharacterised protein [Serratia plymuthica]
MRLILVLLLLLTIPKSYGIVFPTMTDVEIVSCDQTGGSNCAINVYYRGTVRLLEIGEPVTVPTKTALTAYGIHCAYGNPATNTPFSSCNWNLDAHSPLVTNCFLANTSSWALGRGSDCSSASTWGAHSGAAPGGECVMFGILQGSDLLTPSGLHSPYIVANGGNRFCTKPLPPGVVCDVSLPPLIDHGSMLTGTRDTKYIEGKVNCGTSPVVTIVGSPDVTLAPGVSTKISTTMSTTTDLRIQSDMNVESSALPGAYSASVIVAVSPW